ncbi:MAG: HNH endonuclease signature motif containing protein [Sulfuricella sp.]
MKRHRWSSSDADTLRALYATHTAAEIAAVIGCGIKAVYTRARYSGLKKSREWIAERTRQLMADTQHPGRQRQFKPGQAPWNKGVPYQAGGRSVATRFQPGVRQGVAVSLWKPVGWLRINRDGYLERKINDDQPPYKRWRGEHIVVWEAANGPLPKGHAICFKDGNRLNCELANLECVSRAALMARNTVHRNGPEVAAVSQLLGAIKRQINRKETA